MVTVVGFANRKVAVFGLGLSGLASCAALKAGGADVLAWDDGDTGRAKAQALGVAVSDLREADWSTISALVLSPGVPLTHPAPHWAARLAHDAGVEVIGDTELFERERAARAPKSRVVAITGTNGKSTTTALVAHILREAGFKVAMGGNIGTPILALDDVSDDCVYVIEYSSYQIDLTPSLRPQAGVLLNLSEDHIDRHGTMANYAAVKARLVQAAAKRHLAVIGVDDGHCVAIADAIEKRGGHVLRISAREQLERGIFVEDGRLMQAFGDSIQELVDLAGIGSLRGQHNWQNAAAAFAACRAMGAAPHLIATALRTFPGLAHRMEQVGQRGQVLFVNDSKATNADAAARALASFDTIFWIAGGRPKTGGISSLQPFFPRIAHAFLIGEATKEFAATLNRKVPFTESGDLETAVRQAAKAAQRSDAAEPVVLLSPACASFDQFANFEVRGNEFAAAVRRLDGVMMKGS